jgi:hypothetical protein
VNGVTSTGAGETTTEAAREPERAVDAAGSRRPARPAAGGAWWVSGGVAPASPWCYAPGGRPRPRWAGRGGAEMDTTATATGAATWVARPATGLPAPPGAGRWGVVHAPTGRWVAFGSAARCRALAAHLTEADSLLRRHARSGPRRARPDA